LTLQQCGRGASKPCRAAPAASSYEADPASERKASIPAASQSNSWSPISELASVWTGRLRRRSKFVPGAGFAPVTGAVVRGKHGFGGKSAILHVVEIRSWRCELSCHLLIEGPDVPRGNLMRLGLVVYEKNEMPVPFTNLTVALAPSIQRIRAHEPKYRLRG
jgi:hypothetical protein